MKIELIQGSSGQSLYLNDTRIAGPKPWGAGRLVQSWELTDSDIDSLCALVRDADVARKKATKGDEE